MNYPLDGFSVDRMTKVKEATNWLNPAGFRDTSNEELWSVLTHLADCQRSIEREMEIRKA